MPNPTKDTLELRGRINARVYTAFMLLLTNPETGRPYYGATGAVLEILIKNLMQHVKDKHLQGIPPRDALKELGIILDTEELDGTDTTSVLTETNEN